MNHFTKEEVLELVNKFTEEGDFSGIAILVFALELRDSVEKKMSDNSIEGVWADSVPWSEETFPDATARSVATHLVSEAMELASEPFDTEEAADIALLLGHWLFKTKANLVKEMKHKLLKNMGRKWGEVNEQGFIEHIEEEEPTVLAMQTDSNGYFFGITSFPEKNYRAVLATYEKDEEGNYTGRKSLWQDGDTGELIWREIDATKHYLWTTKDREVMKEIALREGRTLVLDEDI